MLGLTASQMNKAKLKSKQIFHELLLDACTMNYDSSKKVRVLEPKLDYKLELKRLSVDYMTINNLNQQVSPLQMRSNVQGDSDRVGDCYGVEVYWSFEHTKPSPQANNGCCRLGRLIKITQGHESKKFSKAKLHFAFYSFSQFTIKIGFSYGQDFFAAGQLMNMDLTFGRKNKTIKDKVSAKTELRLQRLEKQFDKFFQ